MRKLKLKEVENIDSGIIWIDLEPFVDHIDVDDPNDSGPVRFGIRVMYTEHWSKEWASESGKYHVGVYATAPEKFPEKELASALQSHGLTVAEYRGWPVEEQARFLIDSGHAPTLWQETGNNLNSLLKAARSELRTIKAFTFGFAMDKYQNRIGATGWDWIMGTFDPSRKTA